MTIRTRNRFIFILFICSLSFLLVNSILLIVNIYNKNFNIQSLMPASKNFSLIKYNPYCVIISLFFEQLFAITVSIVLYRTFENTHTGDIIFFSIFLFTFITDAFRLWIPILNIKDTYSRLFIFCGNASLFSKLLTPASLLFVVIEGTDEQRQDVEKNLFVIIFASIFFAKFIPLNTVNTLPNFAVDYSFRKAIQVYSFFTICAALVALFINNKNKLYKQLTTIGFFLLCCGKFFIYNSTSILRLSIAIICLTTGCILFLKELHNQYLWND